MGSWRQLVDKTRAADGIDALVNDAGIIVTRGCSTRLWAVAKVIDINATGPFLAAAPWCCDERTATRRHRHVAWC
jgi:NAD(P)-dependent dehydrogenase (short-subunit alcohol dehydrogenase family)